MSSKEVDKLKEDIDHVFSAVFGAGNGINPSLSGKTAAKLYEIKVLAVLLKRLQKRDFSFKLLNPTSGFKGSPGYVNNNYTYIEVFDSGGNYVADIRTDTEFIGLSSYALAKKSKPTSSGEYHELDIMVCERGLKSGTRPRSDQIYIAVECKHWASIPKKLLREILGVRRELSFLNTPSAPQHVSLGLKVKSSSPASELIFAASKKGKELQGEWSVPTQEFEIDIWDIPV